MPDLPNTIEGQCSAAFMLLDQAFALCELVYDDAGRAVDYRFYAVNPACETMTGIRAEDQIGRTGKELVPTLDDRWIEMFDQVVRTGQSVRFEHYVMPRDRWFSTFAFSLGGAQFGTLVTDITSQKHAEQALRNNEARYRALAYASADTFYRMSADASVLLDVFSRMDYEQSPVELPNAQWIEDYVYSEDRAETAAKFAEAIASKSIFTHEHRVLRTDGTVRWILSQAVPVPDAAGEIIEWIGSASDITDRKRAEQHNALVGQFAADLAAALTTQQVTDILMSAAIRVMGGGLTSVYRVSADGVDLERLTHSSDPHFSGHERLPLKENLLISRAVKSRQFVCIESREALLQQYPHLKEIFEEIDANGIGCFPFFGSNGAVIGALYVTITGEMKQFSLAQQNILFAMAQIGGQALERTLLADHAQEMATAQERNRIARDLHDSVNQVLFASTMFAEALPTTWERSPEAARSSVKKVVTLNRAAMAEMRKLLLELRPAAIVQTPFVKLLQQLMFAAQGLDEIDAELQYDGPDDLVLQPETQVALYRIAQEAVNNMTKHSGAKHLKIAFKGNSPSVRLVITDNGRGFDPARTTMGLGMNTMRERAERCGAHFEVHSAPGEGTRITVELAG